ASMAIDGELLGSTVRGPRQRSAPPELSSLLFSFKAERLEPLLTDSFLTISPAPPTITFLPETLLPEVTPFAVDEAGEPLPIREERVHEFNISPDIFGESGFGRLAVDNPDGDISIPKGVRVVVPSRGALTLKGANVTILGQVSAPS